MTQILVSALPIALLWIAVTGRIEWGSLLVGYVIGLLTLVILDRFGIRLYGRVTLRQLIALTRYSVTLLWNGLLSSVQVARMLLRRDLQLKTGIIALDTGDRTPEQRLAALSAHGLNMTPGQLVIDFSDDGKLYVHLLNFDLSDTKLKEEQAARIRLLRELMGVDEEDA